MINNPFWRRIAYIEFWLFLFPPWGFWLLYKDTLLTPKAKRRLLFYTFAIPVAVLVLVTVVEIRETQKVIDSINQIGG